MLRYACIARHVVFKVLLYLYVMFNWYTSFEEVLNAKKKFDNTKYLNKYIIIIISSSSSSAGPSGRAV
jgi:hypothetical protein